MCKYWFLSLVGITISLQCSYIDAVVAARSETVPTELFQPVETGTEKPLVLDKVPQVQQNQQQPQQQPQFIYRTFPQQTQVTPQIRYTQQNNNNFESNPFLPRQFQTRNREGSNEFSFENDGNRVGTNFYQSSVPGTNSVYWYTSSGSTPEIKAQLEAQVKKRLEQYIGNFQNQQGSFGDFPSSNRFYRQKSYETTYDSNGASITKHYEYDSRNGARTYVTYD